VISARITVVLFILICFEIGILLIFLPWHRSWHDNNLLFLIADRFDWPWLARAVVSGYARGLVSGLGVVNVLIGVWEIVNFRSTVRSFDGGDASVSHN
jgi:hypothetical protein